MKREQHANAGGGVTLVTLLIPIILSVAAVLLVW